MLQPDRHFKENYLKNNDKTYTEAANNYFIFILKFWYSLHSIKHH